MSRRLPHRYSKNQKYPVGIIWFFCLMVAIPAALSAQTPDNNQKIADVRVVIDVSGSMKQNDPHNLRQPALELLVKLLQDDSKAGVWTFGKYINMLVPHGEVNQAWRQLALDKGKDINSTGLFTNIGDALEKAAYDYQHPNDQYRTSIILLTDGMVDIDREPDVNQREWRRVVDEVLSKIKKAGYTLHTIALSDNADSELMNKLAVSTDGIAAVANSADDLMKIFLAAFDNAAPAEQVPLSGNSFVVDSSVEEFTALIFTRPGSQATQLISPESKQYTFAEEDPYLHWYHADKYDLITVEKPIEGEWLVQADIDPDSRITVVSNLNLVVKPLKNNLFSNEQQVLSLLLSENGSTITRTNFLALLDIRYQIERLADGKQWQASLSSGAVPANGVYSTTLDVFTEESDYRLTALVDGKSFTREFTHTFSVRQPFSISTKKEIVAGNNQYQVVVSYYGDDIDRRETKVVAQISDPNRHATVKTLALTESDNWLYNLEPELEGQYELTLSITAVNNQGKHFELAPDPVLINTTIDDPFNPPSEPKSQAAESDPQPEPVLEPELEPEPELEAAEPELEPEPEPEPEPEVSPVVAPDAAMKVDANAEDSGNKLWLYGGLGLGNVLILLLAFMAYRMIMGKKGDTELEQLEHAVAELDANKKPAEGKPTAPSMAQMDSPDDEVKKPKESKQPDAAMPDELNIAGEEETTAAKKNTGEMPPMHDDTDSAEEDGDSGVTDVEFSLDDFSSDDLDDDD